MSEFFNEVISKAKKKVKTIALPESYDDRVLKAANIIQDENIANIVLIGNKEKIHYKCNTLNITLNDKIKIIDPEKEEKKREEYALKLYSLRQNKGMQIKEAQDKLNDYVYFAIMMLYLGEIDGVVSGAIHSTADTLRPALQIIPKEENVNYVSSFFLMETKDKTLGKNGVLLFSDCGLIEEPNKMQLEDIANLSVKSFRMLVGNLPKVAFLSYSSFGSAKSEKIDKIKSVVKSLREKNVDYELDGEMQLDCAVIKEVAKIKAPDSKVAGNANILIFPNLESGNIGYKIAQRFGNMEALGPITQGLKKPVNDLSRGCNVEDIIGVVAITCVQAQNNI